MDEGPKRRQSSLRLEIHGQSADGAAELWVNQSPNSRPSY